MADILNGLTTSVKCTKHRQNLLSSIKGIFTSARALWILCQTAEMKGGMDTLVSNLGVHVRWRKEGHDGA